MSGVGVLDKAVVILAACVDGASLAELVDRTKLPRATAHRLAQALEIHRMLVRDTQGRWRPGPRLGELANAAPDVLDWLESDDDGLVDTAYLLLGNAGLPMPDAALEAGLARDPLSAARALTSAGMSQHPRLPALAADFHRDQRVRTAAAWWLREGGRVAR